MGIPGKVLLRNTSRKGTSKVVSMGAESVHAEVASGISCVKVDEMFVYRENDFFLIEYKFFTTKTLFCPNSAGSVGIDLGSVWQI